MSTRKRLRRKGQRQSVALQPVPSSDSISASSSPSFSALDKNAGSAASVSPMYLPSEKENPLYQ